VSEPTDLQIIEAYIERRDFIKKKTDEFELSMEIYKGGMKTLENEMLRRLNERGSEHSATDAGTAYKESVMQIKCTDKAAYHAYAIDHYDTVGKDLLTAHVSKETLKLIIDQSKSEASPNGVVPPGLAVNFESVVRFRKA